MLDAPFFSICVPVYNVEDYLAYCIESLLAQTFKDYEVILVDDGSTDMSPELCDRYAAQRPNRIRVIHQGNRGLFSARCAAFKAAGGRFCLCVDSDDALAPRALELLHKAIAQTGAQMVFFDWTRSADFAADRGGLGFCKRGEVCRVPEENVLDLLLTTRKLNNMCFKAFSSECLPGLFAADGRKGFQYGEDLYATLALIGSSMRFAYVAEPLYYYRRNEASLTHTYDCSRFEDIAFVRATVRKFAERRYAGRSLEKVLEGVSRVDLMQAVDLAEMVCLSGEAAKADSLDEVVTSPLYRIASVDPNARNGLRADYALLLHLLGSRKYRLLELTFRSINRLRPFARRVLKPRR